MKSTKLLGQYLSLGFSFREPDDHLLEVYHGEKKIATYNQARVSPDVITNDIGNYIRNTATLFARKKGVMP